MALGMVEFGRRRLPVVQTNSEGDDRAFPANLDYAWIPSTDSESSSRHHLGDIHIPHVKDNHLLNTSTHAEEKVICVSPRTPTSCLDQSLAQPLSCFSCSRIQGKHDGKISIRPLFCCFNSLIRPTTPIDKPVSNVNSHPLLDRHRRRSPHLSLSDHQWSSWKQ